MPSAKPSTCPECRQKMPSKIALQRHLAESAQCRFGAAVPVPQTGQSGTAVPASSNAGDTLASSFVDTDRWLRSCTFEELQQLITDAQRSLDERVIARLRVGTWTYREAATALGMSKSRVHQVYGKKRPDRSV